MSCFGKTHDVVQSPSEILEMGKIARHHETILLILLNTKFRNSPGYPPSIAEGGVVHGMTDAHHPQNIAPAKQTSRATVDLFPRPREEALFRRESRFSLSLRGDPARPALPRRRSAICKTPPYQHDQTSSLSDSGVTLWPLACVCPVEVSLLYFKLRSGCPRHPPTIV